MFEICDSFPPHIKGTKSIFPNGMKKTKQKNWKDDAHNKVVVSERCVDCQRCQYDVSPRNTHSPSRTLTSSTALIQHQSSIQIAAAAFLRQSYNEVVALTQFHRIRNFIRWQVYEVWLLMFTRRTRSFSWMEIRCFDGKRIISTQKRTKQSILLLDGNWISNKMRGCAIETIKMINCIIYILYLCLSMKRHSITHNTMRDKLIPYFQRTVNHSAFIRISICTHTHTRHTPTWRQWKIGCRLGQYIRSVSWYTTINLVWGPRPLQKLFDESLHVVMCPVCVFNC